jgi:hypothetical protein
MFTFNITPEGGITEKIVGTSRDVLQWERRNKGASAGALSRDPKMTDLYKIAYLAAVRLGRWGGTEAEFMESVDIESLDDDGDGEADPTRPAASTGD